MLTAKSIDGKKIVSTWNSNIIENDPIFDCDNITKFCYGYDSIGILTRDGHLYKVCEKDYELGNMYASIRKTDEFELFRLINDCKIVDIFDSNYGVFIIDKNNICWLIVYNHKFRICNSDKKTVVNISLSFNYVTDERFDDGTYGNYLVYILYQTGELIKYIVVRDIIGRYEVFNKKVDIPPNVLFKGCLVRGDHSEFCLTYDGDIYHNSNKIFVGDHNVESVHVLKTGRYLFTPLLFLTDKNELFLHDEGKKMSFLLLENVVEIYCNHIFTFDGLIYKPINNWNNLKGNILNGNILEQIFLDEIKFKTHTTTKNARFT